MWGDAKENKNKETYNVFLQFASCLKLKAKNKKKLQHVRTLG